VPLFSLFTLTVLLTVGQFTLARKLQLGSGIMIWRCWWSAVIWDVVTLWNMELWLSRPRQTTEITIDITKFVYYIVGFRIGITLSS
jgi:hypothetical protein